MTEPPSHNDALALVQRASCSALLITCSDFRFKTLEREFAVALGLTDDFDLIARPGSIRSLVAPRSAGATITMTDEIRLLWSAHGFTRIVAVNHFSCRAYDDLATVANERDIHVDHLRRARVVLDGYFATTKADTYLAEVTAAGVKVIPVE